MLEFDYLSISIRGLALFRLLRRRIHRPHTCGSSCACAAGFRLALKAESACARWRPGDQLRLTTAASDFQRGFDIRKTRNSIVVSPSTRQSSRTLTRPRRREGTVRATSEWPFMTFEELLIVIPYYALEIGGYVKDCLWSATLLALNRRLLAEHAHLGVQPAP